MSFKNETKKANNINFVLSITLVLIHMTGMAAFAGITQWQVLINLAIVCILTIAYFSLKFIDRFYIGFLPSIFGIMTLTRIPFEGYVPEIQAIIMCSLIMAALYLSVKSLVIHVAVIDLTLIILTIFSGAETLSFAVLNGKIPLIILYGVSFNISAILFLFLIKQIKRLMRQLNAEISTNNFSCQELSIVEEELQEKYNELEVTNERLRDMNERFKLVMEASNEAMYEWDFKRGMVFSAEKLNSILGFEKKSKLTVETLKSILYPDDFESISAELKNAFNKEGSFFREIRLNQKSKADKWILVKAVFRRNARTESFRMIGSVMDISKEKRNELTIQTLAFTDSVTGLPNREAIIRKNDDLSLQGYNAILLVGLLNFSDINANYGYESGDGILKGIGERLSAELPDAIISRLRASDFAVLVKGGLAGIQKTLDLLSLIFKQPFLIGPKEVHLKYNVGAALAGLHGEGYEIILKRANLALLEARRGGYEGIRIFEKNLESFYEERIGMENDFRRAVFEGEINVFFQPKFRTNGPLYGFEALARWSRVGIGSISPEIFIGLAEETGLIIEMGLFVAKKACEFLKALTNEGIEPEGNISINISPVQLAENDFVEKLDEVVRLSGADAGHIGLEITESVFIGNKVNVIGKLKKLREKGFKIYLDDFGKDYSNFSYLEDLPLDYIKIDKEFIKRLEVVGNSRLIVKSIIDLTHSLGCRVVAEGVETDMQLELLKDLDCDFIQGFLKGRPAAYSDAVGVARIG